MLLGSPATNVGQTEKKNLNKKAPKMVMDDDQVGPVGRWSRVLFQKILIYWFRLCELYREPLLPIAMAKSWLEVQDLHSLQLTSLAKACETFHT